MKLLIHIGLPKTATTMLQNEVLYKLHESGQVNFLGRSSFTNALDHNLCGHIIKAILRNSDAEFETDIDSLKADFTGLLEKQKLNVISEEMLAVTRKRDGLDFEKNILRLNQLTEGIETEYLITTRKQEALIYSLFIEYMGLGGARSSFGFNSLAEFLENGLQEGVAGDFKMYYFDEILNALTGKTFHVLPYELLKKDPPEFSKKLEQILGLQLPAEEFNFSKQYNVKTSETDGKRPRTSLNTYLIRFFNASNPVSAALKKTISFITPKSLRNKTINKMRGIKFKGDKVPFFSEAEKQTIRDAFAASNANTSKIGQVNLESFGYSN